MRRALCVAVALACAWSVSAGDRVPGDQWMRYADPGDAGFDAAALDAAHETWKELPSSAFMVVSDGAVVAAVDVATTIPVAVARVAPATRIAPGPAWMVIPASL